MTHLKRIKWLSNDKARVIGYEQPDGEVAFYSDPLGYLVLKMKGYLAWSARSEQTYIPAHYQVYRITMDGAGDGYDLTVEHMFDFPLRRNTPRRVYREGHLKEVWNE